MGGPGLRAARRAAGKIPGLTRLLDDGDRVPLPELDLDLEVLAVPGHTLGHIAYYEAAPRSWLSSAATPCLSAVAGACSRARLQGKCTPAAAPRPRCPGIQRVYCAHEYTLSNLDFARTAEPGSGTRGRFGDHTGAGFARARGEPSVPSTLAKGAGVQSVPALRRRRRWRESAVAYPCRGKPLADAVGVFAELRRWKDGYKSALK